MKQKTHKATSKRIRITQSKKIIRRQAGQDHFNARDKGIKTRSKRKNLEASSSDTKRIAKLLPHAF